MTDVWEAEGGAPLNEDGTIPIRRREEPMLRIEDTVAPRRPEQVPTADHRSQETTCDAHKEQYFMSGYEAGMKDAEGRWHSQRGIATYAGASWKPQPSEGIPAEDLPLSEWIGQAVGAASTCWVGGTGALEFDSARAKTIAESLEEHIRQQFELMIRSGRNVCGNCYQEFDTPEAANAHVRQEHRGLDQFTLRELLNELRTRAEENVGQPGSGWLADRVDDSVVTLVPYLDQRREWS